MLRNIFRTCNLRFRRNRKEGRNWLNTLNGCFFCTPLAQSSAMFWKRKSQGIYDYDLNAHTIPPNPPHVLLCVSVCVCMFKTSSHFSEYFCKFVILHFGKLYEQIKQFRKEIRNPLGNLHTSTF